MGCHCPGELQIKQWKASLGTDTCRSRVYCLCTVPHNSRKALHRGQEERISNGWEKSRLSFALRTQAAGPGQFGMSFAWFWRYQRKPMVVRPANPWTLTTRMKIRCKIFQFNWASVSLSINKTYLSKAFINFVYYKCACPRLVSLSLSFSSLW